VVGGLDPTLDVPWGRSREGWAKRGFIAPVTSRPLPPPHCPASEKRAVTIIASCFMMEAYPEWAALKSFCQVWWCTPVISAIRRLKQEDLKFKDSLYYIPSHGIKISKKNQTTCHACKKQ
jgi:hypothetical protein